MQQPTWLVVVPGPRRRAIGDASTTPEGGEGGQAGGKVGLNSSGIGGHPPWEVTCANKVKKTRYLILRVYIYIYIT